MNKGASQFGFPPFSGVIRTLVISSIAIWFFAQVILEGFMKLPVTSVFALYPIKVITGFQLWQLVTYMFLHSLQVSHIVFNMLMLWMMGAELEARWGRSKFLFFYFFTGIGAGLIYTFGYWIYYLVVPDASGTGLVTPVVGASGAIFGLLLAYGILFGERVIHFMFLFPMKAKYFVLILGLIELASLLTSHITGGEKAYLAHIGGLVSGYLALVIMSKWKTGSGFTKMRKKSNLKLVVDNEKAPKYWN